MQSLRAVAPDLIFSLANTLAFVSWLALAASPCRARWAPRVRRVAGFVGAWIAERAGMLGLPHLLVLPLLALTFLFGPAGLLAFAVLRLWWLRRRPQPVLA